MDYLENEAWRPYYQELDEEKRWKLYEETVNSTEDDGANALRKKLYEKRYTNPKKPGKKTDNGKLIYQNTFIKLFLIAKTAACVRSITPIFLKILEI